MRRGSGDVRSDVPAQGEMWFACTDFILTDDVKGELRSKFARSCASLSAQRINENGALKLVIMGPS